MRRTVGDYLKEKGDTVYCIDDSKKLKDVVKIFNEKNIGALIVIDKNEDILGIITERDIMRKLAKTEGEVKDMNVKFSMTPREKLVVGTPEDTMEYLMKVMTSNHIRHIPIIVSETDLKLRGLISIGDSVKALLNDLDYNNNRYLKEIRN